MVKGVWGFAPDPFNHLQLSLFSVFRKNKLKKRPEPRHYSSLQVVLGCLTLRGGTRYASCFWGA